MEILAGPIIVGLILLFVEYRSGLFQETIVLDRTRAIGENSVIFLVFILFVFAIMGLRTLFIWLRPHRYFREEYAGFGVLTIFFLIPTVLGSFVTGIMPWGLVLFFITGLGGARNAPLVSSLDGYLLLGVLAIICWATILAGYRKWDGRKSLDQHRAEQKGERVGFFAAGIGELIRVFGRRPPSQAYRATSAIEYVSQLEPVVDTLAWKDLAKDLLRLSSSVYAFDPTCDWHDRPGCWLGSNVKTGDVVCLFPPQYYANAQEIGRVIEYADQIAAKQNRRVEETVVAIRSEAATPTTEWGGRPIRFETESTLLDGLVNFRDYENEIRRRVRNSLLPDSQFTIDDVYVPSRFYVEHNENLCDNVEQCLRDWIDEPGRRQLALLGEYGQGKSTAALMFTYHLLREENDHKRIPILIELRGRSPRSQTPLGLLGDWAAQYRIDPQALMRLLIAGRLVLIFEGFDEMALVGDAEMRLQHFSTLWKFSFPQAKLLITGRPNFFLDEKEMKGALGISGPTADRPYCEAIRLAPFSIDQIDQSLRNYETTIRNQICSLTSQNTRFRDLVARPSLLHLVASLWRKERLSEKVEQLNSAYVMDLFIHRSYSRQGLKHEDSPGFMALTTSERGYFMRGIAAYMAAHELPNQISGTALNSVVADLIELIPDSVTLQAPMISGESRRPLRSRLEGSEHGLDHVQTDVRACGLLVDDPASPGTFRFGHKSFMEYLFAALVADYVKNDDPSEAKTVFSATSSSVRNILSLPTAIDFLSEIINASTRGIDHDSNAIRQRTKNSAEFNFARQLLGRISSSKNKPRILSRFELFDAVYAESSRRLSTRRRFALFMFRPWMLVALLVGVISNILLDLFVDEFKDSFSLGGLDNPWVIILFISGIVLLAVILAQLFFRSEALQENERNRRVFRRYGAFGLWNSLCRSMGIGDQVLHRVAGSWLLPWAKEQTFDYFLSDLEDGRAA